MTTFYLIRHGATDALGREISGRAAGVPLNAAGREQASRLPRRFAGVRLDALYSSPLDRTRQTADPLASAMSLEVQLNDDLHEIDFGDWTGWSFERLAAEPAWQVFNRFRSGTRPPGGESMAEAQVRMVRLLERLAVEHGDAQVGIVTHGDPIKAALLYYLGAPLDHYSRLEISPASISVVVLGGDWVQVRHVNVTQDLQP